MKRLVLTTLVIAGARHLEEHRDLTGLEIDINDLQEAIGRVSSFESALEGDRSVLALGLVREEIDKLLK